MRVRAKLMLLIDRPPENHSLKKDQIFPNVYLESIRGPSADGLDDVWGNTCFSEESGADSMHGLPCNMRWEKITQFLDEPGVCWHNARLLQPEFRFEWVDCIARFYVGHKDIVWICSEICFLNYDRTPLKEAVSLVARQQQ